MHSLQLELSSLKIPKYQDNISPGYLAQLLIRQHLEMDRRLGKFGDGQEAGDI